MNFCRQNTLSRLIIICLVLIALLPQIFASTPGPISTCQTIDTPGTYSLTADINASGTCFTITADNVIFDGNNHSLIGDGNVVYSHYAIYAADRNNLTIRDLNVVQFVNMGIWLLDVNYATISGVKIGHVLGTINPARGFIYETIGLYFNNCHYGTIIDSNFTDNNVGIDIDGPSTNNLVTRSTIAHNDLYGIDFWGRFNTVSYNVFRDNNRSIQSSRSTTPGGEFATITNNLFIDNNSGYYHAIDYSTFSNNVILNSRYIGFELAGTYSTISNNFISSSGDKQIYIFSGSQHNAFVDTNIYTNNDKWIYLEGGGKMAQTLDHNFTGTTFEDSNGAIKIIPKVIFPTATTDFNSSTIKINQNSAFVNTTFATYLNTNSTVTLYNMPSYRSPKAQKDGTTCPAGVCASVASLGSNKYSFDVNSFSTYSLTESGALVLLTNVDGNSASSGFPYYSYQKDGNITIDFNVTDPDSNNLLVDINYSTSASIGTGTSIVHNLDINSLAQTGAYHCLDTNFLDITQCSVDWNISGVADGNYYLHISVTDGTYADVNSTPASFMIDNTAPAVAISSPSSGNTISRNTVTLTYTVTDAYSGVKTIWVSDDNTTWIDTDLNTTHDFYNQTDGTHRFYVKATDNIDNNSYSAYVSVTISVPSGETKPPTATVVNSAEVLSETRDKFEKLLGAKDSVSISFFSTLHKLSLLSVTFTQANIQIQSTPQLATLLIGETKEFDLNADGINDITITLQSIQNLKASFLVETKKFSQAPVVEPENPIQNDVNDVPQQQDEEIIIPVEEKPEQDNSSTWIIAEIFAIFGIICIIIAAYFKIRDSPR